MHGQNLAINPEKGNKPSPNNGSKQHFAVEADENRIVIKTKCFPKHFWEYAEHDLHFKAEEKESEPISSLAPRMY